MNTPVGIRVRHSTHRLELSYEDGTSVTLPAEFLRIFAPKPPGGQRGLVAGKRRISLLAAEPVGKYALRLRFSDGFDTGIYSWDFLAELGREQSIRWRRYLRLLEEAGLSRD